MKIRVNGTSIQRPSFPFLLEIRLDLFLVALTLSYAIIIFLSLHEYRASPVPNYATISIDLQGNYRILIVIRNLKEKKKRKDKTTKENKEENLFTKK